MRNFGIEMEMHNITAIEAQNVIRAAGIIANAEGYNHNTSANWKVVTDSSIRDDRGMPTVRACEVVSPILNGENGFEQVAKVCNALTAAGAKVNKSTGLHVHVDATGLSVENVKSIFARYEKFENDIDAVLPVSRRANNNTFCQTLRGVSSRISRSSSIEGIAEAIMTRYTKVNIQSYLRHGTVEFRQHSGTVDAEKAINWVKFCLNFVETSISSNIESRTFSGRDLKSRLKAMFAARQDEALTVDEIRGILGLTCKDITITSYIARIQSQKYAGNGGAIELTKVGGTYKQKLLFTDSAFRGLAPEVISYFNARAALLSGIVRQNEVRAAA